MEYGQVKNKETREFLRSSELLLDFLRQANDGKLARYELLLVQSYLASIRAAVVQIENSALLHRIDEERRRTGT